VRLTSPLKWHGGKHYLAPKLVAMMPPHTHYVEPFAGGLSVLLAKNPEGVSEVVNDLNGELSHFWAVLRCPTEVAQLARLCDATPFSEELFRGIGPETFAPHSVDRAWRFLIHCRQSMAGRMKDFATLSRTRTRRGMNEQASQWLGAIEGLPKVHQRLKRVVILNRKATNVIRQQDGPGTLFYLDPPYLKATRTSPDVYAHEMTEEQHVDLCTVVRKCAGKVMLSGYPSELYRLQLEAEGWHRTDFDLPNNAAGGKTKRRMVESVWTNFNPAATVTPAPQSGAA
jgi:DNA adenine methylase